MHAGLTAAECGVSLATTSHEAPNGSCECTVGAAPISRRIIATGNPVGLVDWCGATLSGMVCMKLKGE